MNLLLRWIINAVTLLLISHLLPSIHIAGFGSALITALILGFVNAFIRPILIIITLPINILTLGLFTFVINGLLFWFVAAFIKGFDVGGFWSAFFGALAYSAISSLISMLLSGEREVPYLGSA
jgi:putative membrane protein